MAQTKAVQESRGFTTDYFERCCLCLREIPDDHATCACGAIIERVRLQPKQKLFLDYVLATGRDVPTKIGYGGSRAAGKSRGLREVTLIVVSEVAQKYAGIPACIMRRNWTQCKENHYEKFRMERPRLSQYYGDKQYQFPCAMKDPRLVFQYADTPDDVERLERGPEFFFMGIDQAEQIAAADLQRLNSPNRWPSAGPGAAKSGYFFNPGSGSGSAELKRLFYDRKFRPEETPGDYVFIQAYGWDNWSWFENEEITINGRPLTWEEFYELPGDLPECPGKKYTQSWLKSIPATHRFRMFVEQTSEGRKHWQKPESIRMGDLFGRFDQFSGQYMAGIWSEEAVVIR